MNPVRINILVLAAIAACLVGVLAVFVDAAATVTIAGSLIGGYAATMTKLSEPAPDPAVPSSIVERLLGQGTEATLAAEAAPPATRINILVLALIGAVLVGALASFAEGAAVMAVLGIAGTLVGGVAATMSKLCDPAPDPSVPASVVKEILERHTEMQLKLHPREHAGA